jgi:hypothetical protein
MNQKKHLDKYESEKAFRYYRNKYKEMSLYYGFPIVLNDNGNTINVTLDEIISCLAMYDMYQKFKVINLLNVLDQCEVIESRDTLIKIKIHHVKYIVGITKRDSNKYKKTLVISETLLRSSILHEELNFAFEYGDNLIVFSSTNKLYFLMEGVINITNSYLGEHGSIPELLEFYKKNKFHDYDLAPERIDIML